MKWNLSAPCSASTHHRILYYGFKWTQHHPSTHRTSNRTQSNLLRPHPNPNLRQRLPLRGLRERPLPKLPLLLLPKSSPKRDPHPTRPATHYHLQLPNEIGTIRSPPTSPQLHPILQQTTKGTGYRANPICIGDTEMALPSRSNRETWVA